MGIIDFVMSLIDNRRHGCERRKGVRDCACCGDVRRVVTWDESNRLLSRAVDDFSETITLNHKRTQQLFHRHLK